MSTGQSTQLTKNQAPENNVAWSPDGRAVTYVAPHDKYWELDQGNLYIHPVEGGGSPTILGANFPGDIGQYYWHPSAKQIVMSASLRGRGALYELDLSTGRTRAISSGDVALSISSAAKGLTRVAGTYSTPAAPAASAPAAPPAFAAPAAPPLPRPGVRAGRPMAP